MIAIAKLTEDQFRKDMFKAKRKVLDHIWLGEAYPKSGDIVRFTPSACNTQPWLVEGREDSLQIFRHENPGKSGIMPASRVTYYNRIDMAIFLLFLELCLAHENIRFERMFYNDIGEDEC